MNEPRTVSVALRRSLGGPATPPAPRARRKGRPMGPKTRAAVLRVLRRDGELGLGELSRRTGHCQTTIISTLLELSGERLVEVLDGDRYRLRERR